ncbi:MAG: hypothetical protein ACRCUY_13360 [Thermoguttaceae bacterium]
MNTAGVREHGMPRCWKRTPMGIETGNMRNALDMAHKFAYSSEPACS